jgi:ATP-dependent Clp protease ATP-binding subunit ClpB
VLFDEVEKAHPDVWNTLLQVLDDGRLTDGQGRTVDFKNTVIILTSNVGSHHAEAMYDEAVDEREKRDLFEARVMEDVRKAFRPEFLNRLDEIVVFQRLEKSEVRRIVDLQLARFTERLAARSLAVDLSDDAKAYLAEVGWDPKYGARPLKRAVRKHLEDELAKHVLRGDYVPGSVVHVDRGGNGLVFKEMVSN